MATLVLTTVGTIFGGPLGGAIGGLVGRQIDSSVFGSGVRDGPRLRELSITTSSYGQPIPRHFGRMRVAGTVIWSTDLIETSTKEGGGKGRPTTTSYSYSASFAVALSSTPICKLGRIWADGSLLRGTDGDLKAEGEMRSYLSIGDHPVDPLIAADKGPNTPAFRDSAYVVFENLQLGEFGNRIPALSFELFGEYDAEVTLAQLVPEALPETDASLLQEARGFSDEGGPIISSLSAIDRVIPLTCVTKAEGLVLGPSLNIASEVPTLPEQLSPSRSEEAREQNRQRGDTLDREPLALRYYDEERDYQPSVQRAFGLRSPGRETMLDLPVSMTADGARKLANSNASRTRWRDEQIVWRTGALRPDISAGSLVRVPAVPGIWFIRSWEWYDRGVELTLERLAPALAQAFPGEPGAANLPPDLGRVPTKMEVFEVPAEQSGTPSQALIMAAATAENGAWRGASLFVEQGDTLVELGPTGRQRAILGHLVTNMPGMEPALLRPNDSIEVELIAEDLAFESTDIAGMAMGSNRLLIGGEVVQFIEAIPLGSRRWRLCGLLRGRGGTEDAASIGHASGTLVASLDGPLQPLDPLIVPSDEETRIAAIGLGDNQPVYATLSNVGLSRRPPMPVSPVTRTFGDGSVQFRWTRRARGQWRWSNAAEVPLIEENERYLVGFGPTSAPYVTWPVTTPQMTLTAPERDSLISDFGPATLWVRQIGTHESSSALLIANLS